MTASRRVQRVEKELQHIIANYLVREFRGRLRGLVSVSRVESNPKLRTAKVYISVLGSDEDRDVSLNSLKENIYEIQKHVNAQLRMKFVPRIDIVNDEGLHKLLKVESLLREISTENRLKTQSNTTDEDSSTNREEE